MGLSETLIFYLLIGLGVAAAVWLTAHPAAQRWFPAVTAVLFWPLYVPVLLSRPADGTRRPVHPQRPADSLAAMIVLVETELDAALASLDGWAEEALARENARIVELKAAWALQAARIREMDRLLVQCGAAAGEMAAIEWPSHSEQARRENLDRLSQLRGRAYQELTSTLAAVRELATLIHLAKFSGAPAARAGELVAQIAAAIEGISEVNAWRENTTEPARGENAISGSAPQHAAFF
jgi:hypothetical protein